MRQVFYKMPTAEAKGGRKVSLKDLLSERPISRRGFISLVPSIAGSVAAAMAMSPSTGRAETLNPFESTSPPSPIAVEDVKREALEFLKNTQVRTYRFKDGTLKTIGLPPITPELIADHPEQVLTIVGESIKKYIFLKNLAQAETTQDVKEGLTPREWETLQAIFDDFHTFGFLADPRWISATVWTFNWGEEVWASSGYGPANPLARDPRFTTSITSPFAQCVSARAKGVFSENDQDIRILWRSINVPIDETNRPREAPDPTSAFIYKIKQEVIEGVFGPSIIYFSEIGSGWSDQPAPGTAIFRGPNLASVVTQLNMQFVPESDQIARPYATFFAYEKDEWGIIDYLSCQAVGFIPQSPQQADNKPPLKNS